MVKWRDRECRNNLFKCADEKIPIVVYDLETTGLRPDKDRIIQFSAIKIIFDGTEFVEIDRFNSYVNPEVPISPRITEITGITDEMVADAQTEDEIFYCIKEFFGEKFVASGYNVAKFDNKFMQRIFTQNCSEFSPVFTVDVIEMAKDNVEKDDTENFKLGTMAKLYGVDEGLTFHNAMDDVTATARLLSVFYKEYKDSYETDENPVVDEKIITASDKKIVSVVYSINYWAGFKGNARIYITTDIGDFYYDVRSHIWAVSSKNNPYSVDEVDMNSLQMAVFKKCGAQNEAEFLYKNTPHKTDEVTINTVNSLRYWEKTGDTKQFHRIYIDTDVGKFFYDIDHKRWYKSPENPNINVNMETLKKMCFEKASVETEEDFAKYR